jgi:CelD/BcsL family acetyltransferase involved in cellulose biosynthesis
MSISGDRCVSWRHLSAHSETVDASVDVVRKLEPGLIAEWDELADSINAPPWCRPGWFEIWLQQFAEGPPIVFTCRRQGDLIGVLPLVESGRHFHAPVNDDTSDFRPIAINRAVAEKLWIATFSAETTSVTISKLPGEREFLDPLLEGAKRARTRIVGRSVHSSPFLDMAGDWSDFEKGLSSNWRQGLRRKRRQLEKAGRLEVEVADGSARFDELFTEGLRVEPSGWKRETGTALIADEKARTFYESIARWAATRGWLRMVFLRLDGRAIAFRLDLETGGTYYHLKGGYDPEFGFGSPGNVLTASVIESSFDRGVKRYEFLGAAEAHKLRWTQTTRELQRIKAFDRSLMGTVYFLLYRYVRPVVARFRS